VVKCINKDCVHDQQWTQLPGLQCPSQHRCILRVTCHPERRNNTTGVAPKDALLSQVRSPQSVGSATLSTDEHCKNTALRLHATSKITFELTDHLSDSTRHGGDPLPTCAPSDWPEKHLKHSTNGAGFYMQQRRHSASRARGSLYNIYYVYIYRACLSVLGLYGTG
jgi:hypothetical protein